MTFNPDESLKLETMERFPLELLEKRIQEIEEFIQKGDGQQAAEKAYSVVESCIKILAEKENLEEYYKAQKLKRWLTDFLWKAARKLKDRVDKSIWKIWDEAWNLHVKGFHERYWDLEDIKEKVPIAKEMLEITKKHLGIT